MTLAYFDTSAFIRCLIEEPGATTAHGVWAAADDVASVRLLYPEARSALSRARRAGRLTRQSHGLALESCEQLWREVTVVEVDAELAAAAGELAEREALRAYDAVHLAAALAVRCDVLVSADGDLCRVGTRRGLSVMNLDGEHA